MNNQILELVKNNLDIPKSNLELYEIKKDGNCFIGFFPYILYKNKAIMTLLDN